MKEQIEKLNIPKSLIAELAEATPSDVSLFLRRESLVSVPKQQRIRQAVEQVSELIERFSANLPIGTTLNLKNAFEIRRLIELRKQNVNSILSGDKAAS